MVNRDQLFNQFMNDMKIRLKRGSEKYGDLMSECDEERAIREVYEELVDVANHAFLLYLRQKKMFEDKRLK